VIPTRSRRYCRRHRGQWPHSQDNFIARTENITPFDGTAPKRFIVIGFESVDKAKAWDASPAQQEVDAIRIKSTKSRSFIVEGM